MDNTIVDLVLSLARQQNKVDITDDELIHILKIINEGVSITDAITSITKTAHPVKWGTPTKWGYATWG